MNKIEKEDQQKPYAGYSEEADRHWAEVMAQAEKYGFILQAYAGSATLATHRVQLEQLGESEYLRIQQMNGHCPKDFGCSGCLTADGALKDCGSCWAAANGGKWVRFEKNGRYKGFRAGR